MDPDYIKSMALVPHDQTSNQILVDIALNSPSNADLLKHKAQELKGNGWVHIYTRMVGEPQPRHLMQVESHLSLDIANRVFVKQAVAMAKENIESIRGRVLLQTLPSKAYDEQGTLDHARLYDEEFKRVGVSRNKYCIKIPATGPALNAAKTLEQERDAEGLGIQRSELRCSGFRRPLRVARLGCYTSVPISMVSSSEIVTPRFTARTARVFRHGLVPGIR